MGYENQEALKDIPCFQRWTTWTCADKHDYIYPSKWKIPRSHMVGWEYVVHMDVLKWTKKTSVKQVTHANIIMALSNLVLAFPWD